VKPSRFTYHAPESVPEALRILAEHADAAKVLAGGQSLMPILSFRLAAPGHLVDINRLPGLDKIERLESGWRIGALVRQRSAERSAGVPLMTTALTHVAHPQIRNRGTVCGSLAHADSSAELPTVMVALDATMHVAGPAGHRAVPAAEFFEFHLTTTLQPDELLLAVEFPDPIRGTFSAFSEFAPRKGDFCLAGAAVTVTFGRDGRVERSRVVAAGVAPVPLRLTETEALLSGSSLDPAIVTAAQAAAYREVQPTGDVHASAAYRRQLASVLVRRALVSVRSQKEEPDGT
jgi:aerobic carbon-monoxide dehydrogenase medium subunit